MSWRKSLQITNYLARGAVRGGLPASPTASPLARPGWLGSCRRLGRWEQTHGGDPPPVPGPLLTLRGRVSEGYGCQGWGSCLRGPPSVPGRGTASGPSRGWVALGGGFARAATLAEALGSCKRCPRFSPRRGGHSLGRRRAGASEP